MEITKSICAIAAEVGSIGKNKKNKDLGYQFRGIDDFMNALHPLFAKYGVFTIPEVMDSKREERVTAKGSALISTILTVKYHFMHMDGSEVCAVVVGEGMDSGDKSANKALSVAFKYACIQVFCIPTEEIAAIDPDNSSPDRSISAERVVLERLRGCNSFDELKQIAATYGDTIQRTKSLMNEYTAVKDRFLGRARR